MWAIVPLKGSLTAKSRLAAALTPTQRNQLFYFLADRVITALQETPGISNVAVVTASDDVAAFAHQRGAIVIQQTKDAGTAAAFAKAVAHLHDLHLDSVLMIMGDLPLVTPSAIAKLLDLAPCSTGIVIAPDRQHAGTNALICSPPDVIAPCFGKDSFNRHMRAAKDSAIPATVLELEELALDLDTPADLACLSAHTRNNPAFDFLKLENTASNLQSVPEADDRS